VAEHLSKLIGDALVTFFDGLWPKLRPRTRRVFDHMVDAVRPDPPMTVRTIDGATFTGLVVADRGQVLIFIGTRVALPATQPTYRDRDEELFMRQQHPFGR
jgi:hypothetical protein